MLFAFPHLVLAGGPTLLLSPETVTMTENTQSTFSVLVDTTNIKVFGADAILTYNPSAIEITNVTKGTFFTDFTFSQNTTAGKLEIHGYFGSLYDMRAGTGTVATFTVKAKKGNGSTPIDFICNNSANSSQILDDKGKNILPCEEVNTSVITFTSLQPSTTISPTPGNTAPNCNSLSLSPSTGIAPFTVSATCTASDGENDIVASEFDFGNGTKKVVENNIGRYGSISTSYTYQNPGLFTVICRVKDNNQVFSAPINECTKSLLVNSATRTTPTTSSSFGQVAVGRVPTSTIIALSPYITPTIATSAGFITPYPTIATPAQNAFLFQLGRYTLFAIVIILTLIILRYVMKK